MITLDSLTFETSRKERWHLARTKEIYWYVKAYGPTTCGDIARRLKLTHQCVSAIASHCDLFKVEKKKVDELFTCIKAVIPTEILRQDNGKYSVIAGCCYAYKDIEKINMDGKYALLYKTVPIYKTYISLSDEGVNLV